MMRPCLCVVLHDVADATRAACERVLEAVAAVADVPVTLSAVPRYHGAPATPELHRFLEHRMLCGDELALHGYTHLDMDQPRGLMHRLLRQYCTRGEGEFVDLAYDESVRRIDAGMRWFERNGWPLYGFIAPAWLLGKPAWQALQETTLRYTCTLARFYLLPQRQHVSSMGLCYSSQTLLRRSASIPWNLSLALAQRHNPVMRLELHPHDADHPAVRRSWQQLLARQVHRRRAMTLGQLAERLHERADWESQTRQTSNGEDRVAKPHASSRKRQPQPQQRDKQPEQSAHDHV